MAWRLDGCLKKHIKPPTAPSIVVFRVSIACQRLGDSSKTCHLSKSMQLAMHGVLCRGRGRKGPSTDRTFRPPGQSGPLVGSDINWDFGQKVRRLIVHRPPKVPSKGRRLIGPHSLLTGGLADIVNGRLERCPMTALPDSESAPSL